jgi:DNA-binding MarR family transcriptional regulator
MNVMCCADAERTQQGRGHRLEEAGCVVRRSCEDDARAQLVVITEKGRALRKRMWPVYATSISRTIGAALSDREAINLGFVLDKVIRQNE